MYINPPKQTELPVVSVGQGKDCKVKITDAVPCRQSDAEKDYLQEVEPPSLEWKLCIYSHHC